MTTQRVSKSSWGLAEGDLLTDQLTVLKLLGGGAAYEAYLAFDETTYGPVVVKVLRPDQVDDEASMRGLRREIAALAAVNHPVVVRGLRHDTESPRPHVVLEHIDGPRLSSLLRRHGPLQAAQYLPLAIDLASAVHYLGQVGQVHLDIKPSNVIMGAPARLIDLSLMRTTEVSAALAKPIGTDAYMAPEQCLPGEYAVPCPASDVWGLGATLFRAVAGYLPFDEGDPDAADPVKVWPQLGPTIYDLPESVPAEVSSVIHACLATLPGDRPAPAEVADAFAPLLERMPRGRLGGFKIRR
ncbi:serine/threonine-protein kinase [Nocardioides sp. AE5]|uniref:serine/threonine-protein kinase n=1 Tax=Nocardioides sp. AE5 TaxID=2962573 RepID=UPI0028829CEB|nr:serine/threonine-protein kinase [Nocardioides sp. AE5]MDT0203332.1 serine/threonine-protein kinase [Nocardioides sp. AE5]